MTIRTVVAPAVALDSVTRTYRSRAGSVHALRGVTHAFAAGTFTAIMDPRGRAIDPPAARGRPRQADQWPGLHQRHRPWRAPRDCVDEVPSDRHGVHLPVLQLAGRPVGFRQRRTPDPPRRAPSRPRRRHRRAGPGGPTGPVQASAANSPAGSSSASPSPAPSMASPTCSSPTNPPVHWTATPAATSWICLEPWPTVDRPW